MCLRGQGCLSCSSWDTVYLICGSHGSGCLFWGQHGRGIHCVPHRTGVSNVCLLGHRVFNMKLTWQWMSILRLMGHKGSYMCITWHVPNMEVDIYSASPGTQGI